MMIYDALPPVFEQAPSDTNSTKAEDPQDSFLTLMLTQLQNQDPIEPMDNGEFLSQLASFETATGIGELQESFTALAESLTATQTLQSAALVDKDVIAETSLAVLEDGEAVEGRVPLTNAVENLTLEVTDATGAVVRRIDLGARAGTAAFEWDGRNDAGRELPDGAYRINAIAANGDDVTSMPVELASRVDSVLLGGSGEVQLTLANGETVALSAVREIS